MTHVPATPDDYAQLVASALRGYLAERRITQTRLARMLGETVFWVGRRVNGDVALDVSDLARLSAVLEVPASRFTPPMSPLEARRDPSLKASNTRRVSASNRGCVTTTRRPTSSIAITCDPIAA